MPTGRLREGRALNHCAEKQNPPQVPLNFLLGCPPQDLDSFQLARLASAANLRSELQATIEKLIDELLQAGLAAWFRKNDREALKNALETAESAMEWAKRMIRGGGEIIPQVCLEPGQAHRIAAQTYQSRNIAAGKCSSCPEPLAHNSVKFCEKHLAMARNRERQKKGLSDPGSREYLYSGEVSESGTGRHPNTLASLAMNREKKTRAVLAELGIPPESAAVSLEAAKAALLKCMPETKGEAVTRDQLFQKASIPTRTTGQNALKDLLLTDRIERRGKGGQLDPYRYFVGALPGSRRKSTKCRANQNEAIQKILKGEE
jgi:hypothetical protein